MVGGEKGQTTAIMEAAISSSMMHPNIVTTYYHEIKPMKVEGVNVASSAGMVTDWKLYIVQVRGVALMLVAVQMPASTHPHILLVPTGVLRCWELEAGHPQVQVPRCQRSATEAGLYLGLSIGACLRPGSFAF
jgi:hypothetical protein